MLKLTFILVTFQIMSIFGRAVDDPANAAALHAVANDGLEFSKRFYQATANAVPGNLISSPISASSVLSMLAYGARGSTETALKSGLHFNKDDNVQKKGLKTITEELNARPVYSDFQGVELRLANKIFLANDVNVKSDYQELAEDVFKSSIEKVDFSKSEEASNTINNWCEQQTESKIKKIVSKDDISPSTLAVLVNAAYFKGRWMSPFEKSATRDDLFTFEDGTIKNVSTMHAERYFNYGVLEDVKAKFAELPYQGSGVSMFIILPDEIDGLKNLQQNFAELNLNRLLTEGRNTELNFSLPKIDIETEVDLNKPLTALGMGQIFEPSADFSGMFDKPVKIDKAIQKAFIKIDEEGTEAAAITALFFAGSAYNPEPPKIIDFHVDRPFYYAIVKQVYGEKPSGIVLFQGHYKSEK